MFIGQYVLDDDGNPIPIEDILVWGTWMQKADRHVGNDHVGDVHVSTVFLGLDHSFGSGPPVLWETMIFGGEHDQYQERYTSKEAALEGHKKALALVGEQPKRLFRGLPE